MTGPRKLVWLFDSGGMVLAEDFGMFAWVWVLLRGVAKTIVPSDWC